MVTLISNTHPDFQTDFQISILAALLRRAQRKMSEHPR
jgi:hypothetical protein